MSQKTFSLVAGLTFLLVAAIHVLRLALEWRVDLAGWAIPMWVSWVAIPVAGFLAFEGLRLSRRP